MGYTTELTQKIVEQYEADPQRQTVDRIAEEIGKSPRSVIAKLASEGVYRTPERTTKTGDPIVKKETLVSEIEKWLDISAPTLVKSGKQDLKALHEKIEEDYA